MVQKYAAEHAWIELARNPPTRGGILPQRRTLSTSGYARVKGLQYDVIGNLDADVSFEDSEYVEFLMSKFAQNPGLGVCGTANVEENVTCRGVKRILLPKCHALC